MTRRAEDICAPEEFVTKGGPPPECDPAMEVVVAELNNDGSGNGIDFDWGEDAGTIATRVRCPFSPQPAGASRRAC